MKPEGEFTAGDYATGLFAASRAIEELMERFLAKFGGEPCDLAGPDVSPEIHELWHELMDHECWARVQLSIVEMSTKPETVMPAHLTLAAGLEKIQKLLTKGNELMPPTVN